MNTSTRQQEATRTRARHWPALALTLGLAGIPAHHAQADIFWPGGGSGGNDKEADFKEGYDAGQADCRTAPLACGVKLGDMIKNQGYGETEPNNHIINADGLLPGQFYHANSLDANDEDWYYVNTDRKNQKLTVYFLGDSGNYTETAGWLIRIRDLKGNVIAAFDSTAANGGAGIEGGPDGGSVSPVQQAKITEVTLGRTGSYYISVSPKEAAGTLRGYHIGVTLKDTGQVTGIEGDNPYDTETEPNNDPQHADVLRSNVAMLGVFDRTLIKYTWVTTPAQTEYRYFYRGCDPHNPATLPPGASDCSCDITQDPLAVPNITMPPPGGFPNPIPADYCATTVPTPDACDRVLACEAQAFTTPAKTEKRGLFHYDTDVYVYHSEGNEQLRIQICTRTQCQFEKVHLRVNKGGSSIVLLDGPIQPGEVIDMGAALPGDYYFVFSAEEEGVNGETGEAEVAEILGPYDVLLMGTRLSPSGGNIPTSSTPPQQPPASAPEDDNQGGDAGDGGTSQPFSWFNGLPGG